MQKIGVFLRSKIPLMNLYSNSNEQIYLLNMDEKKKYCSSQKRDSDLTSVNNPFTQIDSLHPDWSENDLILYNEKSNANRIDEWQAGWNVTNAIQGMFVVSLPYAVANGGYWALLAMILVSYVCCYTGKILIDCLYHDQDDELINVLKIKVSQSKRRHRIRASYVDIAKDVWGNHIGARLVNIAQNIELLMTCILYLVLCGDLFVGSFPNLLDHSSWTMISCMILIPCAFIRSLKFVSRLSLCNAIVHLIINLIIIVYCMSRFSEWDFKKIEIKINIWSFPISLGIIVFSYTSQIFLPTMEGNMKDKAKFNTMLWLTHLVAAFFKALFGLVGFLTWQENTDEVITNNLPTKQLKIIVNLILVIKALLSYPLPYFASVELLESSLFISNELDQDSEFGTEINKNKSKPLFNKSCYDPEGYLNFWAILLRIGLILFTLFLAIFIPHFAILMGLIGSITGTMLSLIWPCYFHLHLKYKRLKWYQILFDSIIILFGILITITGVYYSSVALIKALRNEDHLSRNYYKKNNFFSTNSANYHNINNNQLNGSIYKLSTFKSNQSFNLN